MDQIIRHLKNSRRVLVVTHASPDGDAIGSLIAMGISLAELGKKTTLYNESPIPAVYRFLPSVHRVERQIGNENYDTAIVLDCSDPQRIGKAVASINKIPVVINIDHHITNTRFGTLQLVDTSACACTEIVYRLLKQMDVAISKDIATLIYTGILTDTGSFRFANTNQAAFVICEEMVAAGVDPYDIAQHVYGTYSLGRLKLLNLALDSIEISLNGKLSIMTVTQNMFHETRTQPEDVDGLINYAKNIEDVKIAVLIQEHHNSHRSLEPFGNYHVSLRSDGTLDVAKIAASFGGGGHTSAAGFNIESNLWDLKSKIFNLAEEL